MMPNQIAAAPDGGFRVQFSHDGSRHRPGVAESHSSRLGLLMLCGSYRIQPMSAMEVSIRIISFSLGEFFDTRLRLITMVDRLLIS